MVAYFGRLDQPFDVPKLFVIPWRTKARSDAAALALPRQLTAPFLVTKDTAGNLVREKPWHLVILMDLAEHSAFVHTNGPRCDLAFRKAERPAGKRGTWKGYA